MSESDLALSIAAINTRVTTLEQINAMLQASVASLMSEVQRMKSASSDVEEAAGG